MPGRERARPRDQEPGDLTTTHQGSQGKQCGDGGRYGWRDNAILGQLSVAMVV
jgi:hypothetical protein